jgi:hypothetical protein
MSLSKIEGRPAPDRGNPYDQATKRPADQARQRELDQVSNDQRAEARDGHGEVPT